jgi:hypothetical protein
MSPTGAHLARRGPARLGLFLFALGSGGGIHSLVAAALGPDEDKIPPLRPPRGLIAPDLWEQYGTWVVCLTALGLMIVGALVWLLLRPKRGVALPPAVRARTALEPLRGAPESGAMLSRVSQIIRTYYCAAFDLPPLELTTSEFCRAIQGAPAVGPELSAKVGDFLRECDKRKFSRATQATPLGAVARADNLLEEAETRRQQLRVESEARADAGGGKP